MQRRLLTPMMLPQKPIPKQGEVVTREEQEKHMIVMIQAKLALLNSLTKRQAI